RNINPRHRITLQVNKMYKLIKIPVAVSWKFLNLKKQTAIIFFRSMMRLSLKGKFKVFYKTKDQLNRVSLFYVLIVTDYTRGFSRLNEVKSATSGVVC